MIIFHEFSLLLKYNARKKDLIYSNQEFLCRKCNKIANTIEYGGFLLCRADFIHVRLT